VKPYLMDLEAKTKLNGEEIEPARYYEMLEKDVIGVGSSEYVLMSR
jgi:smad nuclear-interacting protein 1